MIYVLLLVMVTAVWGWTFVLVKDAVTQYPTLPFLQIRFAVALVVMPCSCGGCLRVESCASAGQRLGVLQAVAPR